MTDIIQQIIDNNVAPITSVEKFSCGTAVSFLDVGVMKFEPKIACSTSLIISCGIHGNETAPQEIVSEIIHDLIHEKQKCNQRILFIFGNPQAMAIQKRFVDINLNRLFCHNWRNQDASLTEVKRAAKLESYVTQFFAEEPDTITHRLHYDCHTSIRPSEYPKFAVYPFVEKRKIPDSQLAFLARCDVESVVLQRESANTFSSFTSSHLDAQSFTLELGKVAPYGGNDLKAFSGFDSALRDLISGEPLPIDVQKTVEVFEVCHEIVRTSEQWQFNVEDNAPNFTHYEKGYTVWQDESSRYTVSDDREFIVFPNAHVPIGQRAGLMLRRK